MNRREKSSSHSTLDSSWMWPKLRRLSTLLPVDVSYCICQIMFLNVLSAVSMKSYKLNTYLKENASRDVSYFSRQASTNLALVEQVPISQDFTWFVFSLFYIYTHTQTHIYYFIFRMFKSYFNLPLYTERYAFLSIYLRTLLKYAGHFNNSLLHHYLFIFIIIYMLREG